MPSTTISSSWPRSPIRHHCRPNVGAVVDVDDLVLPDYDHLPAAHVVAKLASLTPAERDAVEAYEHGQSPPPHDPRQDRSAARDRMIDPTVRRCTGADGDVAQLRVLEIGGP